MRRFSAAAGRAFFVVVLSAAAPLGALAQSRAAAGAAESSASAFSGAAASALSPSAGTFSPSAPTALGAFSAPLSAPSLNAPSFGVAPIAAPSAPSAAPAASFSPVRAVPLAASLPISALPAAVAPAAAAAPALAVLPAARDGREPASALSEAAASPDARVAAAAATIENGVSAWGGDRRPEDAPAPAPAPDAPNGKSRPRLAKGAFAVGAAFVGVAATAVVAPAALPAAVIGAKGVLAYSGFGLLALSRFWKAPSDPAAAPVPPAPAEGHGTFATFRAAWGAADGAARTQAALEARVGASSKARWRDWFLGGLRSALFWLPVTLGSMVVGAVVGKGIGAALGVKVAAAAAPVGLMKLSLLALALGPLATNLLTLTASLAAFDAARFSLSRLGAGKAATPLAIAAAIGLSAIGLLALTHSPFVIAATLASTASMLVLRARSRSWLAPLALGGMFSALSIDSARVGVWLKFGAGGALSSLPAVWMGGAVAVLLVSALVWSAGTLKPSAIWAELKRRLSAVSELGAWWRTPSPDGAPKSPVRLLKLAALWGLVVYAFGDLTYWATNAIAPGAEPAPAALAKMLTSPVDLVLYNFLFVGFFEEFVFRRGIFGSIRDRLAKWGLTAGKAFWTAAVASALIFSGAHYVDYGSVLAHFHLADAAASSGLGGSYAFSWPGFVSRSALGVLLAWMYQRSGTLAFPAFAHAAADTLEGLGLRWGAGAFLSLAALVVLVQRLGEKVAVKAHAIALPATPAYKAFRDTAIYAGLAAAVAPVLWGAAPAMKAFFLMGGMAFVVLPAIGLVNLVRLARLKLGAKPWGVGRRARAIGLALGLALGIGAGSLPQIAPAPFTRTLYSFSDTMNLKRTDVRPIPGATIADETVRVLSANPVGRKVLDGLRDRGGVVRMPRFYLRSNGDDPEMEIVADHEGLSDGVFIGPGALKAHGWSAEEFLRRPDWQKIFVAENQETLAHELTHADQARRSPLSTEYWTFGAMEHEYEAYANEALYVHERLKADPSAPVDVDDMLTYEDALDRGLVASLKSHDADYPQDRVVGSPRWAAIAADLNARWPALRAEGYMSLAARQQAAGHPRIAESYRAKARAAAAAAGLPDPTAPPVAAR